MSDPRPVPMWEYATKVAPRQKQHRRWSAEAAQIIRAMLLIELERVESLIIQYTRCRQKAAANQTDPIMPFLESSLRQYHGVKGYITSLLHNIGGMNYLASELRLALERAGEYVPPPFRAQLEIPEAK